MKTQHDSIDKIETRIALNQAKNDKDKSKWQTTMKIYKNTVCYGLFHAIILLNNEKHIESALYDLWCNKKLQRNKNKKNLLTFLLVRGIIRYGFQWFNKFSVLFFWGISSAGRAQGSQSWGQGFDPPMLHHNNLNKTLKNFTVLRVLLFCIFCFMIE